MPNNLGDHQDSVLASVRHAEAGIVGKLESDFRSLLYLPDRIFHGLQHGTEWHGTPCDPCHLWTSGVQFIESV